MRLWELVGDVQVHSMMEDLAMNRLTRMSGPLRSGETLEGMNKALSDMLLLLQLVYYDLDW